jgi:hypothetical protein
VLIISHQQILPVSRRLLRQPDIAFAELPFMKRDIVV